MYKAKCIKESKPSGLMFIEDAVYAVEKCKFSALHKYVIVRGAFTNPNKEIKKLERVILADICREHLEIMK